MRHIYNGSTSPPRNIYRTVDGNPKKILKAWRATSNSEYVKVWDVTDSVFEIKVARNQDGTMSADFQFENFLGSTEVIIDFGDGSSATLNSKDYAVTHTYDESIDNAIIKINAKNCTQLNQNFLSGASYDTSITVLEVSLSNNITMLGRYAFYEFSLIKVKLTENVERIDDWCFAYNTKLSKISLKQVAYIGVNAFNNCTSFTEITTPKSATYVGESAFYGCTNLKKAILNQSCDIASYQFYNCQSLSEVIISDNVTGIGNHVFFKCKPLTSITIPNSVKTIGQYIFDGNYIRTINCNFTRQELVQRAINVENIIEDYQSGVVYMFHCTDGDIVFNGSDYNT